jgi:hypothetical protein
MFMKKSANSRMGHPPNKYIIVTDRYWRTMNAIDVDDQARVAEGYEAVLSAEGYEAVLSIEDYFDGPRSGVANFHGVPHYFNCAFDEACDEYSHEYDLVPLDQDGAKSAQNKWQIFLRWRNAFDSGKAEISTHPALPEEIDEYKEVASRLQASVDSGLGRSSRSRGEFVSISASGVPDILSRWKVKWQED